jgi:hypothetical protein
MSVFPKSAALLVSLVLAGCDTLHGVRIELKTGNKLSLEPVCIQETLRKIGYEVESTSPTTLQVREKTKGGAWFFVSHENPMRVEFYFLTMHEPLPCDIAQRMVDHMRIASKATQEGCFPQKHEVSVAENWAGLACKP